MDDLIELVDDVRRRRPVYVVSLPEGESSPTSAIIDPFILAVRCTGIAHIVVLTSDASFYLTDKVGRLYSVFRNAVRTYLPNCDFSSDSPYDHPLVLPERITAWRDEGPVAFETDLIRRAAKESLSRIKGEQELPSFTTVKQTAIRLKRTQAANEGKSDADLLALAEEEIGELKQDVDRWLAVAESEEDVRKQAEQELTEIRAKNRWLRDRIDELEGRLQSAVGGFVDDEIPIPNSLAHIKTWADKHLPGLVHITGRALRTAKGSQYEDIELVYKSGLLLARQYRDMRLGAGKELFELQCARLGIECSPTHASSRAGERGDEYFVEYHGRRRYLDTHLKKGNSREPRHCLRVYFFWDEDDQQVIIGSLPGHLTTRAS